MSTWANNQEGGAYKWGGRGLYAAVYGKARVDKMGLIYPARFGTTNRVNLTSSDYQPKNLAANIQSLSHHAQSTTQCL